MSFATSPTTSAPTSSSAKDAVDKLLNTIKIVIPRGGLGSCPVHPRLNDCECPAALAALTPEDIRFCKTHRFLMPFEGHLLFTADAFNFTNDQTTRHAFIAAMGTTPRHFAREFLRRDGFTREFGFAGKQKAAIGAMLEFWVLRNKQWKEKYGTYEAAKEHWKEDEYHLPADYGYEIPEADMQAHFPDLKPGDTFPLYDFTVGPPQHSTKITVLPLMYERSRSVGAHEVRKIDARILKRYPCHADCGYPEQCIRASWPEVLADLTMLHWGVERPVMVKEGTSQAEMEEIVRKKERELRRG